MAGGRATLYWRKYIRDISPQKKFSECSTRENMECTCNVYIVSGKKKKSNLEGLRLVIASPSWVCCCQNWCSSIQSCLYSCFCDAYRLLLHGFMNCNLHNHVHQLSTDKFCNMTIHVNLRWKSPDLWRPSCQIHQYNRYHYRQALKHQPGYKSNFIIRWL